MSVDVRVLEDPARAAAELLAEHAHAGANLALSGGTTVGRAYATATRLQPRWRDVHAWFGDERAVPPSDPRSNYRLVRETLLDALAVPPEVHRVRGELPVEEAAALYNEELTGITLELALNGIGPDGHTASLFPGSPALDEQTRLVLPVIGPKPPPQRLSMTFPLINASRHVCFLVAEPAKRAVVEAVIAGDPSLPASRVCGCERTSWLLGW